MSIIKYQKGTSFWRETSLDAGYHSLTGDLDIDVAIVGGGIAGLSAGYLLKQSGLTVAILEKKVIGGGTTGYTTGKVTSQHNLKYATLQERFGKETARLYGEANETAVALVRDIVRKEGIDCDWRDEDNYVFTEKKDQIDRFRKEAEVAKSLGLPASFETVTPLPFPVQAAVKFSNQGTFHARKYGLGLAQAIDGEGSYVFEHTEAERFTDGAPTIVRTKRGTVRAKHLVIASLVPYPITTHTAYGVIEYPLKSYIVATRTDIDLPGMYITPDNPTFSILPVKTKEDQLLLVGGQSHIPGLGSEKEHYDRLIDYARERFNAAPTKFKWSAWDYLPYDEIPVVGKLYPWSKNIYVASGFIKWGLSNGTVSGMILRDLITGEKNPWARVYDSTRSSTIASIPRFLAKLPRLVG